MIKRFLPLIVAAAVFLPMLFVHSCANTTQAPTGGDKDTIPPLIIDINPLPGAVNVPVKGSKIIFRFDEYVTIKNQKNIFLSPPPEKPVKARIREKFLIVEFESPLDSNTTYTLHMSGALADNNEGNMFPGYTYVFSTGPKIDSLLITGKVEDCNTLNPVKEATVMLFKDLSDSAIFLHRPDAAVKTDDWGYFCLPYLADTLYRLYAIKDEAGNNLFDPDNDLVGFVDSIIRPVVRVVDTLPEMLKYDMLDTLMCEARRVDFKMRLFREKSGTQYLKNRQRTSDRAAYITFQAPNVWIDSLWFRGYKADQVISEFNIMQDSLLLWVNSRKNAPDTLHLFVNYRKTDTLGRLEPYLEHVKLTMPEGQTLRHKIKRKDLKQEDTTCTLKLTASPDKVEQDGIELLFDYPIIYENFDSLKFTYVNPKKTEFKGEVTVERDSMNLRRYIIRPKDKLQKGYDYTLKLPFRAFRDINGNWSDSTKVNFSLPKGDDLSTLTLLLSDVDRKVIIDLLDEKRKKILRQYIVDTDCSLNFPYLKEGKYSLRVTDDSNRNSIVDSGSLLEHRQPEPVLFFTVGNSEFIEIPAGAEVEQDISIKTLFTE